METHYTWAGLLSILIIFLLVIKYKLKLGYIVSNPTFIICLTFFCFFGKYKYTNFSFENNILLLLSFTIFFIVYYLNKRVKYNSFDISLLNLPNGIKLYPEFFIKKSSLRLLLLITIFYVILDISINSIMYGSIQRALLRFYSIDLVDDSYTIYKNLLALFYKLSLGILFLFRYYGDIYGKKSKYILISVLLLVLIAVPRGSRGAVMSPFITLIIADIFANRFHNIPYRQYIMQYSIFTIIGISIFLTLTVIRSTKFNSFDDLIETVHNVSVQQGAEKFSEREGELMIADTKLCFETFGNQAEFLSPFYTLYSISISFVPRSLYPSKPVSFGLFINAVKQRNFAGMKDPASLNFPGAIDWAAGIAGEGWANGGFIGLILYSIIFGIIAGKCTKYYYSFMAKNNGIDTILGLQFFNASSCFIRGSLQSTFTPVFYTIVLLIFIIKIYKIYARIHCSSCVG